MAVRQGGPYRPGAVAACWSAAIREPLPIRSFHVTHARRVLACRGLSMADREALRSSHFAKETRMQAIIRHYSGPGAVALFELLEANAIEVQELMQAVPGLVSYTLVRTAAGGYSVSIGTDESAIDQSSKAAREWIAHKGATVKTGPPVMTAGRVVAHTK